MTAEAEQPPQGRPFSLNLLVEATVKSKRNQLETIDISEGGIWLSAPYLPELEAGISLSISFSGLGDVDRRIAYSV